MAVTTYEVGAIFTIINRASPVLLKVAEQLAAIDKQIAGLGTGASNMRAIDMPPPLARSATALRSRSAPCER